MRNVTTALVLAGSLALLTGACGSTRAADSHGMHGDAACTCAAGKAGETTWCDACGKGFVDGKSTMCKGCVEASAAGTQCDKCSMGE